jgi:hypothetical protein
MEWVASTLHTTSDMVYRALPPLMRTPDAPAELNRLVRFLERRNLASVHVPSHFKCSLTTKPSTEGSGTTDTIPSCMDAATLPEEQKNAEVHMPACESRESDN